MSGEAIKLLYITLRRSFAGTRETQRRTLQSLGFRYREQTVVQKNDGATRGAIDKVGMGELCFHTVSSCPCFRDACASLSIVTLIHTTLHVTPIDCSNVPLRYTAVVGHPQQ